MNFIVIRSLVENLPFSFREQKVTRQRTERYEDLGEAAVSNAIKVYNPG